MTPPFSVHTTPRFERAVRALLKGHPDLPTLVERATRILETDPHNRSRQHNILKLEGVAAGEGQYRLRLGRWRFRYDIARREVVVHRCGLRREDTY